MAKNLPGLRAFATLACVAHAFSLCARGDSVAVLPFANTSQVSNLDWIGESIAEATAKVIRPGGAFLVYQFSPKVRDFIEPHFDEIKRGFEWINVPPATLFWAYKGSPPRDGEVSAEG